MGMGSFRLDKIKQRLDFPGGSDLKESACSSGDPGSFPGSEGTLPMEKEMATYSRVLAWEIPWTG